MKLVILIILTELTTELLVKSTIFFQLRKALSERSKFLLELLSCGYCFSVWSSLFWCFTFYFFSKVPSLLEPNWLNLLVIWLIVHRGSNLFHGLIDRYFDTRKDIRYNREN